MLKEKWTGYYIAAQPLVSAFRKAKITATLKRNNEHFTELNVDPSLYANTLGLVVCMNINEKSRIIKVFSDTAENQSTVEGVIASLYPDLYNHSSTDDSDSSNDHEETKHETKKGKRSNIHYDG